MTTLALPWPPKELSPNARVYWREARRHSRKVRQDAYMVAYGAGIRPTLGVGAYQVSMTFCPPAAYHYDADNLVARCKALLDGIADAAGVNDRNFRLEAPVIARPQPPHGCVIVTLTPVAKPEAA